DLFGWFGSTLDAKDEAKRLRTERDELRTQVVDGRAALAENAKLRKMLGMERKLGLASWEPVTGTVIGRSPGIWFATVQVDVGSSDGLEVNQPVLDGEGVVGTISAVTTGTAVVTLITDRSSGVSAKILGIGDPGSVVAAEGDPGMLEMRLLTPGSKARIGDQIVTAGSRSGALASLFPPDLPVGRVSAVDPDRLRSEGTVSVKPQADLNRLETVTILTANPSGGSQ
ncbi:MAG: rod shape-determining protein MreC, partial [Actinomycetes bacterium]